MKPRIWCFTALVWICRGSDLTAYGATPREAYMNWRLLCRSAPLPRIIITVPLVA